MFLWFTGPTERKGAALGVGSEDSTAASIYESKWDNALGTNP